MFHSKFLAEEHAVDSKPSKTFFRMSRSPRCLYGCVAQRCGYDTLIVVLIIMDIDNYTNCVFPRKQILLLEFLRPDWHHGKKKATTSFTQFEHLKRNCWEKCVEPFTRCDDNTVSLSVLICTVLLYFTTCSLQSFIMKFSPNAWSRYSSGEGKKLIGGFHINAIYFTCWLTAYSAKL